MHQHWLDRVSCSVEGDEHHGVHTVCTTQCLHSLVELKHPCMDTSNPTRIFKHTRFVMVLNLISFLCVCPDSTAVEALCSCVSGVSLPPAT
jgi:hypothetical protein